MQNHLLRKFFGITALYAIIIFGIFVLQFRSQSVVSASFGALRLTFEQDSTQTLKNVFSASFNGITFYASDKASAKYYESSDDSGKNLTLISWEQASPLSAKLLFRTEESDGTSTEVPLVLSVAQAENSKKQSLDIHAQLPEGIYAVSLPYKTSGAYSVTESAERRLLVSSRNADYEFSAPRFQNDAVFLFAEAERASYIAYHAEPPSEAEPEKTEPERFAFSSVTEHVQAAQAQYDENVQSFRNAVIEQYAAAPADSLTERFVMAYVAEQAVRDEYTAAVNSVPESFRRDKRTYLSAPYFDSLSAMNASLDRQVAAYAAQVESSSNSDNLALFETQDIIGYLRINTGRSNVRTLAERINIHSDTLAPTLPQAAGILELYAALLADKDTLAPKFEGIAQKAALIVEQNCAVHEDSLVLTDEAVTDSVAVRIGTALYHYGNQTSNADCAAAGRFLVNSCIKNLSGIQVLGELYPVLVPENVFYPRFHRLNSDGTVWAWSAANSIVLSRSGTTSTLNIEFPPRLSHYVLFKGIERFYSILIYGVAYRSDARFESYRSSGYVYNENLRTLYLKSVHRDRHEFVRLSYEAPPAPAQEAQP